MPNRTHHKPITGDQNFTDRKFEINMTNWINQGWDLVFANLKDFLVISLIYIILLVITSSTVIIKFVFIGPLTIGIFYVIFNKMRGLPLNVGDISKGFNFFVAAVLADILITVFVGLGYIFLIIPGIVIFALYMFTFPLILDKKMDFWEAMETSRKMVLKNVVEFSIFSLLLHLLLFVGFLLLLVGFVIALPITFAAIAFAYRDIFGLEEAA